MSPKQEPVYWRMWRNACNAQGWREEKGRLSPLRDLTPDPECRIIPLARALARAEHRAVTLTDLRHAVHDIALGKQKTHLKFTNEEIDRVEPIFLLLADETNIDHRLDWEYPERRMRRRVIWAIENRFVRAYAEKICADLFGTRDWHSLNFEPLKEFHAKLCARPAAYQSRNNPF